jgi:hypothetical protein
MVGKGHEDQFRPPSLNGGCRLGKATFAGMGGKEEDAPKPDIGLETIALPLDAEADAVVECCPLQAHLYFFGRPDLIGRHLPAKRFRKLARLA